MAIAALTWRQSGVQWAAYSCEVALAHCDIWVPQISTANLLHLLILKSDSNQYKLFPYVYFTKWLHIFTFMLKSSWMVPISSKRKKKKKIYSSLLVGLNAEDRVESVQLCWPWELILWYFLLLVYFYVCFSRILLFYTSLALTIQYHISFSSPQVNDKFNVTLPSEYEYAYLESLWIFFTPYVK